jgi:hypothetical protein
MGVWVYGVLITYNLQPITYNLHRHRLTPSYLYLYLHTYTYLIPIPIPTYLYLYLYTYTTYISPPLPPLPPSQRPQAREPSHRQQRLSQNDRLRVRQEVPLP